MAITQQQQNNLLAFTSLAFNQAPDSTVLESLSNRLEQSGSLVALGNDILSGERFASQFDANATRAEKIELILNRLGLENDTSVSNDGFDVAASFVTNRLEEGATVSQALAGLTDKLFSLDQVAEDDLTADARAQLEDAAATLMNKAQVSLDYAQSSATGVSDMALLNDVGASQGSVLLAQQYVDFVADKGNGTTLSASAETVQGTATNDITVGTVSSLSTANTLNADDQINGGAGFDVVRLDVSANFGGFSDEGGITGVERIDLNNTGSIDRTFNATGVEGDVRYVIDGSNGGVVNLSNVGSIGSRATLLNVDSGSFTLGYDAEAVTGSSDTALMSLLNVGTDGTVSLNASDVESAELYVSGDNDLDLTGVSATDYTVFGDGDLSIANPLDSSIESFDASGMSGDLSVILGAGTRANASLSAGSGDDSVTITADGAAAYALSGFETVSLANNAGALTFTARSASGIETIEFGGDSAGGTVSGLGNSDITLALQADNNGTTDGDSIVLTNAGATTVSVSDDDAADNSNQVVDRNVTLSNSNSLSLNVAANNSYSGTLTASSATALSIAAAGALDSATVNASSATNVDITEVAEDSTLTLTSSSAELLTVSTDAALNLAGSTLGALQTLDADLGADGVLTTGALEAINTLNLTGSGEAVIGALGSATLTDYGVTVNAGSLNDVATGNDGVALTVGTINTQGTDVAVNAAEVLGGVTLGNINASNGANSAGDVNLDLSNVSGAISFGTIEGNNVAIDVANALDTVTYGNISVESSLTVQGAQLAANALSITTTGDSFVGVFNGGLEVDSFAVTGDTDTTSYTVSGDLDLGNDTVTVDASGVTATQADGSPATVAIDVSGLSGASTTLTGADGDDEIVGSSGDDEITGGAGADTLTGGAGADTFVVTGAAGGATAELDIITDFTQGEDILDGYTAVADADGAATQLTAALGGNVTAGEVTQFSGFDVNGAVEDGTTNQDVFQYESTFFAVSNGNVIQLVGVTANGLTEASSATEVTTA